jgi:hypothetical protein
MATSDRRNGHGLVLRSGMRQAGRSHLNQTYNYQLEQRSLEAYMLICYWVARQIDIDSAHRDDARPRKKFNRGAPCPHRTRSTNL